MIFNYNWKCAGGSIGYWISYWADSNEIDGIYCCCYLYYDNDVWGMISWVGPSATITYTIYNTNELIIIDEREVNREI